MTTSILNAFKAISGNCYETIEEALDDDLQGLQLRLATLRPKPVEVNPPYSALKAVARDRAAIELLVKECKELLVGYAVLEQQLNDGDTR